MLEYKRTLSLLPGGELLALSPAKLDQLGIHKCGHQEAILDSISLLHKTFLDTKGLQDSFIKREQLLSQMSSTSSICVLFCFVKMIFLLSQRVNYEAYQGSLRHCALILASKCSDLQSLQCAQPLPIGHHHGVDPVNANKLSNQVQKFTYFN